MVSGFQNNPYLRALGYMPVWLFVLILVQTVPTVIAQPVSNNVYQGLRVFYETTGGDSWTDNRNWDITTVPDRAGLDNWHGLMLNRNGSELRRMELTGNNLTGMLPSGLVDLQDLRVLNLKDNKLSGTIPSQPGNLVNLRDLPLANNELTGQLPRSFLNLTNLETLIFDGPDQTVCAPSDDKFQEWFLSIPYTSGPTCDPSLQFT